MIILKYYQMMYNGNLGHDKNFESCDDIDLNGVYEYIIYEGRLITKEEWSRNILFKCNSEKGSVMTEWLHNSYGWLLFSENLINILNPIIKPFVQYLPVTVTDNKGIPLDTKYSIMNVLDVVKFDALDLDKTDYDIFEDEGESIYDITRFTFKKDKLIGHHIFRLENDMFALFVSKDVRDIIRKNKLNEFSFLQVSLSN